MEGVQHENGTTRKTCNMKRVQHEKSVQNQKVQKKSAKKVQHENSTTRKKVRHEKAAT